MLSEEFLNKCKDDDTIETLKQILNKCSVTGTSKNEFVKISLKLLADMDDQEFRLLKQALDDNKKIRMKYRKKGTPISNNTVLRNPQLGNNNTF